MSCHTQVLSASKIFLPDGLCGPGWVAFRNGRILDAGQGASSGAQDLGDRILTPGFVDVHAHGGGGAAFTEGAAAASVALAAHRKDGTTSMIASLVTDEIEELERQITALKPLVAAQNLLGIHLEGPWLSGEYRGAHDPRLLRDPVSVDVDRLVGAGEGSVRMVTVAPERSGGIQAVTRVRDHGVLAALGHTGADYATTRRAINAGATVATHLFNAMSPIHHRHPGSATALLVDPRVTLELIADGTHIHPSVLAMATRAAPGRFILVSDAMAAAGAWDGSYQLGPLDVEVAGGVATIRGSETIAGSTLTLGRAVRFMVHEVGVPLEDALQAATARPAGLVGRVDIGRLAPGTRADIVALDHELRVTDVWYRGRRMTGTNADV